MPNSAAHSAAQDLIVSVNSGKKVLLNGVSGSISNGFYAVMVRDVGIARATCDNSLAAAAARTAR